MAMQLRPLGGRLLLKRIEITEQGGISIDIAAAEDESFTQLCEVIAGEIYTYDETTLNRESPDWTHVPQLNTVRIGAGRRVYIARHTGYTIQLADGTKVVVVEAKDVLAFEAPNPI